MAPAAGLTARLAALYSDARAARVAFAVLAGTLCVILALSFFLVPLPLYQWFSDYWEHASAVRVLAENTVAPTNPHYATMDADRQFIPLFVVLGWLVRVAGISVDTALALGATLTTVLFCTGLRALLTRLFDTPWAPAVGLLTMVFAWGNPWVWTGFYEFRALFYNNFYPASFVLSLTFVAWAMTLACLQRDVVRARDLIGLTALAALMFITHQLCGLFAFGGAVLFALFSGAAKTKVRVLVVTALAAGIALTWFWPYFNPITLTVYGSGDKTNEGHADFYRLLPVLFLLGPALLGWLPVAELMRRRQHLALVAGAMAMLAVYLLGGAVGHPVAHRFLTFMTIYLHLAIVWKLLAMWRSLALSPAPLQPRSGAVALAGAAALLVALQASMGALDVGRVGLALIAHRSIGNFPVQDVGGELRKLAALLPGDAVAFATEGPALALTAYKGKVVARPRPQLMIADGAQRVIDNERFFGTTTTDAERVRLIQKYHATHIVIKPGDVARSTMEALAKLGRNVPAGEHLVLIDLRP